MDNFLRALLGDHANEVLAREWPLPVDHTGVFCPEQLQFPYPGVHHGQHRRSRRPGNVPVRCGG